MNSEYKLSNSEIVEILKDVLAAMEIKGVNKFRIRAYQNAVDVIESLTLSVYDLWKTGRLREIQGVGAALEQHIIELFTTGEVVDFIHLKQDLPAGMFGLIGIRGIGSKKAYKLAKSFELTNKETALEELKKLAKAGKISVLPGFGTKSEADILNAIEESKMHKDEKQRILLVTAEVIANRVVEYLKNNVLVVEAVAVGSMRRRRETVGDLDIVVATESGEEVLKYFLEFPEIEDVLSKGTTKAGVVLANDVQVDVRTIKPQAFGSMLQYFTGNKQHNISLRTMALGKGLSLSEYGIKEGSRLHEFASERDFYKFLGISYVVPELRQGKNEVELASANKLPNLVEISDIRGDLHIHTDFSDGINTLEEMVKSAASLGYEYLGIADHAPSVESRGKKKVLNIISTQRKNIEYIEGTTNIKVLLGYEVNILKDSRLGLSDDILKKLDFVVASIHTSFNLPRDVTTERLLAAIKNEYVTIIAHPTGRLINQRNPLDVDWNTIFEAAVKYNKILEINSQPTRLDLPSDLVFEAVKRGVKLIINTDAHSVNGLEAMHYGIDVARRGWCTKGQIVNTLPKADLMRILGCK